MRRREASINDAVIAESERRYLGPRTGAEGGVDFPCTDVSGTVLLQTGPAAARIAATAGTGEPVLRALTGRGSLPRASPPCRQPQDHTPQRGSSCGAWRG